MKDGRNKNWIIDESGKKWIVDEDGNRRVPEYSEPIEDDSDFRTYNTDRGHCGLCGRLTCTGSCFK